MHRTIEVIPFRPVPKGALMVLGEVVPIEWWRSRSGMLLTVLMGMLSRKVHILAPIDLRCGCCLVWKRERSICSQRGRISRAEHVVYVSSTVICGPGIERLVWAAWLAKAR